jgi:hypothetical protein
VLLTVVSVCVLAFANNGVRAAALLGSIRWRWCHYLQRNGSDQGTRPAGVDRGGASSGAWPSAKSSAIPAQERLHWRLRLRAPADVKP